MDISGRPETEEEETEEQPNFINEDDEDEEEEDTKKRKKPSKVCRPFFSLWKCLWIGFGGKTKSHYPCVMLFSFYLPQAVPEAKAKPKAAASKPAAAAAPVPATPPKKKAGAAYFADRLKSTK